MTFLERQNYGCRKQMGGYEGCGKEVIEKDLDKGIFRVMETMFHGSRPMTT